MKVNTAESMYGIEGRKNGFVIPTTDRVTAIDQKDEGEKAILPIKPNIAKVAKPKDSNLGNLPNDHPPKLISMAKIESKELEWLWEGRIPLGGITLLEGDPGHGKSTLMDDLVARLTSGRTMPMSDDKTPGTAYGALLLKGEESLEAVVRPRLEVAGANLEKILAIGGGDSICLPQDIDLLRQGVAEVDAKLIVIDPLPQFVDSSLNSSAGTQRALGPLAALADELNIAVVVVRHLSKSSSRNSIYRGLGSVSIIGLARSALIVAHDPANDDKYSHMLALNKSNLGSAKSVSYQTVKDEGGAIKIKWLGTTSQPADVLLRGRDSVYECSELERAMDFLYGVLMDGKQAQQEIIALARKADLAKRTLYRAKQAMQIKSKRVGRICWEWQLPSGKVEAVEAAKKRFIFELREELTENQEQELDEQAEKESAAS